MFDPVERDLDNHLDEMHALREREELLERTVSSFLGSCMEEDAFFASFICSHASAFQEIYHGLLVTTQWIDGEFVIGKDHREFINEVLSDYEVRNED